MHSSGSAHADPELQQTNTRGNQKEKKKFSQFFIQTNGLVNLAFHVHTYELSFHFFLKYISC